MKQLGIAGHQFYDTNDRYPDVFSEVPWTVHFLPYLEEPDLTAAIKEALETNDTAAVMTHGQIVVPMFVCPESSGQTRSLAGLAFGSYALNFEVCVSNEAGACLDGRSNTVLATEMERNREPWLDGPVRIMEPLDSAHDHISHILLCDGAVRAISIETDPSILQALETPNGGEVVGAF
jgi:hypothetical protein